MVRLINLTVRNFKKLRFESSMQFGDGITLISGLNESGKSTILDAILYALFGRVIRPQKARNEDLISYGAAEATVSLGFEVGDRRYRVTRHMYKSKPSRAALDEVTMQGALVSLATGQEKVNEQVVSLLGGITYHEIVSSTVVAQNELDKLIELNKDDRRRVINAFLNLESFNTVTTTLAEELKDLQGTGPRLGRVQIENEKLSLLKQELDRFNKSAEEKSRLEQETATMKQELASLQSRSRDYEELCKRLLSYESTSHAKENLTLQLAGKKKIAEDYLTRRERLHEESTTLQSELGKFADLVKAETALSTLAIKLDRTKELSIRLSTAQQSLRSTKTQVGSLQSELATRGGVKIRSQSKQSQKPIIPYLVLSALLIAGGLASLLLNLLLVSIPLVVAGFGILAYTVVRVSTATSLLKNQSVLGDLRYLEQKQQDLTAEEQRCQQASQRLKLAEDELLKMSSSIPRYSETFRAASGLGVMAGVQGLLDAARTDQERKNALQVHFATIQNEVQKLGSQAELDNLQKQIMDLEGKLNELVAPELPAGVVFTPEVLSEALTGRDSIGRKLAAAQVKIEQDSQRIEDLNMYLNENAEIASNFRLQEELVKELEHQLNVVRRALDGVQSTAESLRTRVRPSVQSYMSSILPALTSSRYKAAILDENYGLQVWDPDAGEYKPRDVYSGGTEDQFLLAMRLSFALALMPEVKGHKPEFVFLDEPLSSSDEIRRSGIVEYLASDLSKKFKQIFIISHVGELEGYAENTIALDDGRIV